MAKYLVGKSSLCFLLVAPSSFSWIFAAVAMLCLHIQQWPGLDAQNRHLPLKGMFDLDFPVLCFLICKFG